MNSTLTLAEAAREPWGAVVVGAGPAGALAARELARRGVRTLLVERSALPRGKVCGCCLNARAVGVLERVGLGTLLARLGAVPLAGLHLAAPGRSARVALSGGLALSRSALDEALAKEAVNAGAALLTQTRAALDPHPPGASRAFEGGCRDGNTRPVHLTADATSATVSAAVVLAADGLGGNLLARAGVTEAPAEPGARIGAGVVLPPGSDGYEPGTIHMATGPAGYVGLVRLEDGALDLAAAFDPEAVRAAGGLAPVAREVLAGVGWPVPDGLDDAPWKGTAPLTRRAGRLADHRLLVLGDAAGYVEPFTGEGMAWALAAAEAVAPLAAGAWSGDVPLRWESRFTRVVARRQLVCRAAAYVLRRPALTRLAVGWLACIPALAGPVVRSLNSPCEVS